MDQLALPRLEFRRLFGGHGIYADGVFFGILDRERLYFKTGEATRPAYEARGMGPFRPSPRTTIKTYYEVPVEVIEDADALTAWAREAIACQAEEKKPQKPKRPAKKKPAARKGRAGRGR